MNRVSLCQKLVTATACLYFCSSTAVSNTTRVKPYRRFYKRRNYSSLFTNAEIFMKECIYYLNYKFTVFIVLLQAGQYPSLVAKIQLTVQVPPSFLLEFAHQRKHGFSSPRLAKNNIHPSHCGFGQSKSNSDRPTCLANLLVVGLAMVVSSLL